MTEKKSSVHYLNYLQLDKILNAQKPISKGKKNEAHEEMLFIIIHQAYELWFKQIIHEIDSIVLFFKKEKINEEKMGLILARMDRVNKILDVLVDQLKILETMTSLDFLEFRHHLSPASGFQSHQFRKIEVSLGLKIDKRHHFGGCPYYNEFSGSKKRQILDLEEEKSLFDLVEKWLERTPFLKLDNFDFIKKYEESVNKMIKVEVSEISSSKYLSKEDKELRIRMIEDNRKFFKRVLSEKEHNKAINDGETKLSYSATMSALLINLYRDEPILQLPYQLLRSFVELDHKIGNWRFRHVQMVEKCWVKRWGQVGVLDRGI